MIGSILLAAAAVGAAPICPDRPSKADGTCTVPAGHVQLETGLVDWTHDSSSGSRSDVMSWGGTFVKYGLGDRSDIEFGFTPLVTERVRAGGERDRESGFGDAMVRLKQRLTSDGAPVQAAIIPFAKLPTARHALGNGKLEGGIAVPLSTALGKSLSLTLGPEMDLRADADRHGYHAAMSQLVNFGLAASPRLTLSAELWGQWDWDPAGTSKQVSADASAAYLVNSELQLDAGANLGLNRETPDVELYAGISRRF
jgi:hypothetical protein